MQDGHAGFQVWRLDVGDQSHREAGDQPLLQLRDLVWGAIGSDHDLATRLMEGIEGVEKLFLGVLLALDELDVIHQDQVGGAVAVAKGLHAVLADRLNQVIGEGFAAHVEHPRLRVYFQPVVADRLHQVGFAQPHPAAEKEGVEFPPGRFRHRQGGGVGHAAVGPHHKAVEHVAGVQPRSHLAGRLTGGFGLRWLAGNGLGGAIARAGAGWGDQHVLVAGRTHQHLHPPAGDLAGDSLDRAEIVLAQPAAGEVVGGFQPQLVCTEAPAPGWADPGLEGGFAEVGLEGLLNLVPQLISLLHRLLHLSLPLVKTESTRGSAAGPS